jgi:mono/diheme cytochrome c family protein
MRKLTDLLTLAAILALPILLACALPLMAAPAGARMAAGDAAAPAPGQQVFLAQKCNTCHSVAALGIEATTKSEKMKGPDLSAVGSAHDAAFFAKFLRKEVPNTTGNTHKAPWKGTDVDLQTLTGWLAGLDKK